MSENKNIETHIEHHIDKTGWPAGPWMHEPDKLNWRTKAGLPGMIVRNWAGALCGYVAVTAGHPDYEVNYNDVPAEVHGGLTYSDHCQGPICHVPEPGEPEDVWWLGFDACHAFDYSPGLATEMALLGNRQVRTPGEGATYETYRDLAYMQAEVESLAKQLAWAGKNT